MVNGESTPESPFLFYFDQIKIKQNMYCKNDRIPCSINMGEPNYSV